MYRMTKPRILTILIYAFTTSTLAFIYRDLYDLLVLLAPTIILVFIYARRGLHWIIIGVLIGLLGLFINAIAFSNTGETVFRLFTIEVKTGAVHAFLVVSIRLFIIAFAGALLALTYSPIEIYRSLIYELKTPVIIAFPVAYALRILPVVKRDYSEIVFQRKQRGLKTNLLNPLDLASVVTLLMVVNYERAKWSGISAELRGLRRIKPEFQYKPRIVDYILLTLLVLLVVYTIAF